MQPLWGGHDTFALYVDRYWRVRLGRSDPNPMPRIHLWSRRRAA